MITGTNLTKSVHLNSMNLTKCYRESVGGVTTVHSPQTLFLKVCFSVRFFSNFSEEEKNIQHPTVLSIKLPTVFPSNNFPSAAEMVSTYFKNIMIINDGG